MFRFSVGVAVSAFAVLLAASGAWAVNITAADGMIPNATWSAYPASGQGGEDQEVEHGMQIGQGWDLEAVTLVGNRLTLVAGWDFQDGLYDAGNHRTWVSGDVFLGTSQMPVYGDGTGSVPGANSITPHRHGLDPTWYVDSNFGYNLVLDMDWTDGSYTVWELSAADTELSVFYDALNQNRGSNPYKYSSGGDQTKLGTGTSGQAEFGTLADETVLPGKTPGSGTTLRGGGDHYTVSFQLNTVADAAWWADPIHTPGLWTHFTQECGNDNLMGNDNTYVRTPEPMSMVMLGCLGAGMLGARKARQLRKAAK